MSTYPYKEKLASISGKDVPTFNLKGRDFPCKVVSAYDGDTVKLVFFMNGEPTKFSCRLAGIDTPEMHPKVGANDPNAEQKKAVETILAKTARNRLVELATNIKVTGNPTNKQMTEQLAENTRVIHVVCDDFEKYGRLMVHLYPDESKQKSINQILVEEKLAKTYSGGKKEPWV